jgi:signal transduction histidine kinase
VTDVTDRRTLHRLVDAGVAALVAAVAVAEIWVPFSSVQGQGSKSVSTAVVVLACAALAFRRVAPLPTALFVLFLWPVLFTLQPVLVLFWGQFVPMVVVVFSVARHGKGRQGAYGGAAAVATLLFFDLRVDVLQAPGEIVFHWMVFIAAWSVGRGLHVLELHAAESLRRAIEVEVASAERAMTAVVEERTRIARELHDVVAHSVSVMVVQAGAAEQVVDDDPDHVRAALHTIRATGADALAEMRRVLTMLRDAEEGGALSPQPGLGELEVLVGEARSGGLEVALDVTGVGRPLPAGVDLAAYRIVQEALTNVRRHAAASRAEVRVHYGEDALELEVRDDGARCSVPDSAHQGHGLAGMRERAALYGGRLRVEVREAGGFVVHAVLPLAPATAQVAPQAAG